LEKVSKPHKSPYYFFVFVVKGKAVHKVDLKKLAVSEGQLLFILPNQIHTPPIKTDDREYFKMSFDQNCLSLLPKPFSFLINPLSNQFISFDTESQKRIVQLFKILSQLLTNEKGNQTELLLAHLNTLLTEFETAYFNSSKNRFQNGKMQKYIDFKLIIESHLTEQKPVTKIAKELAISTNGLYQIVKEFSGVSPKEFITNRLMLEAQRKLHYSEYTTKELAYELGFNDPDYFSRIFKKHTGKNVNEYLIELQDL
jgi:AraC-like DNA-binding protein